MSVQIDDKNIKFGEKQCENIAMFYLKAYSNPLEYTVQGMNNVIKSLNEKLQKLLEIKFLSSSISLCNADVGYQLGCSREYISKLTREVMEIFNKEEVKAALLEKQYIVQKVVYTRETPIEELRLSTRSAKVLQRRNISNVGELSELRRRPCLNL